MTTPREDAIAALLTAAERVLTARDMFGNLAFDDPALIALWDAVAALAAMRETGR